MENYKIPENQEETAMMIKRFNDTEWTENNNELRTKVIDFIIEHFTCDGFWREELRAFYKDVPYNFNVRFDTKYDKLYPKAKTWRDVLSYM